MTMPLQTRTYVLRAAPVVILVAVFVAFSLADHRFFTVATVMNILRQASYVGLLAIGMTFVLLAAGIDLSVGSIAYLTAVLSSKFLASHGASFPVILLIMVAIGAAAGLVNSASVTLLRVSPFIATLATLGLFRGVGFSISQSREQAFPSEFVDLGNSDLLGVPVPIWIFLILAVVSQLILSNTTFGKHIYAVGFDRERARNAGISVWKIDVAVYAISGAFVGVATFVAMIQLGTAAPSFGLEDEFDAIAAAVLGGASLFGGRGHVFPGTVIGAVLVQTIAVGLVFLQVNLYVSPLISALVIFAAVLIDAVRNKQLASINRRTIRALSR